MACPLVLLDAAVPLEVFAAPVALAATVAASLQAAWGQMP